MTFVIPDSLIFGFFGGLIGVLFGLGLVGLIVRLYGLFRRREV